MSEKKFEDIYEAWNWLYNHPRFNYNDDNAMDDNLYVSIVKVNPFTESICKDDSLNTEIRVWIETGLINIQQKYYILFNYIEGYSSFIL